MQPAESSPGQRSGVSVERRTLWRIEQWRRSAGTPLRSWDSWLKRPITLLLLASLCLLPLHLPAQRYVEISGEIHVTVTKWKLDEETAEIQLGETNEYSVSFVATVGTNDWEMVGNFSTNGRHKYHFDGTNLFLSIQIIREPEARFASDKEFGFMFPPLAQVGSNLTINVFPRPDGCPLASVSKNVAWLALCSGGYLKRPGRAVPLVVALNDCWSDAVVGLADQTKTFADELGLPKSVELFTSKSNFAASGSLTEPQIKAFSAKRPEWAPENGDPDAVSKFRYTVTQSTNFLGWNIPLAFEFTERYPSGIPGVLRSTSGTGRIAAVRPGSKPKGVFDPRLNQTIVDWRFDKKAPHVNAITYRSTNAFLQPMDTPSLQEEFARTAKRNAEGAARRAAEE